MKQIHLFKKCFVIFLKGATFSDFLRLDYQTTNPWLSEFAFRYSGGFFFQLGSNLINKCTYIIFYSEETHAQKAIYHSNQLRITLLGQNGTYSFCSMSVLWENCYELSNFHASCS